MEFLEYGVFNPNYNMQLDGPTEDILFHFSNIDFRYWNPWNAFNLVHLCGLVSLYPLSC
jgi:hypothetical protein